MRRKYRSLFDELGDMHAYLDYVFGPARRQTRFVLPSAGEPLEIVPEFRGEFRVDVREHDDEVIVTADMIPGVTKEDISLDLLDPQALEISCERKQEKEVRKEGYYLRERSFGTVSRIVPLPATVTDADATATFKNGVLEVRLKKSKIEPTRKISIG